MSKRFKTQDHTRFVKLGTRWRKPKGHQSKLRVKKSGSGLMPRIGYGSKARQNIPLIMRVKDVEAAKSAALIAAGVSAKNVLKIAEKAKQLGVKILNMKKIRRAERIAKAIKAKKELAKPAEKKQEKREEIKAEDAASRDAEK